MKYTRKVILKTRVGEIQKLEIRLDSLKFPEIICDLAQHKYYLKNNTCVGEYVVYTEKDGKILNNVLLC